MHNIHTKVSLDQLYDMAEVLAVRHERQRVNNARAVYQQKVQASYAAQKAARKSKRSPIKVSG